MDDFTAWVTGPTAQSNRQGIETIVNEALDWERRSGATFEAEKTAIIHFDPRTYKLDKEPFIIKGKTAEPKDHVLSSWEQYAKLDRTQAPPSTSKIVSTICLRCFPFDTKFHCLCSGGGVSESDIFLLISTYPCGYLHFTLAASSTKFSPLLMRVKVPKISLICNIHLAVGERACKPELRSKARDSGLNFRKLGSHVVTTL